MKLPSRNRAVITSEKITDYLLNEIHRRGGSKARLLARFGYTNENSERLVADIRRYHVEAEVDSVRETAYGTRYEIRAQLQTPSGRTLTVRTIYQIDKGKDFPRLITLFPD